MSRFYGDFDPAATADTVVGTSVGFSWDTSVNSSYYTFADNFTVQRSGSASWGYPAVSTAVFTEGKFSVDFRVNAVDTNTKRTNFGIVATSQVSLGGNNWLHLPFNSNTAHSAGVQDENYSTGDIFTLNVNFDDKSLEVLQNNSSVGSDTFSTSGNFHIAFQEYDNTSTFEVVAQVYAPPTGFTKITQTSGIISTTTDTRSHSHVWNYSDVYDARFAGTWPGIPIVITWDTTTAGSDVSITNNDTTVTIDDTGSDWPNNSAISVQSHSSGKVYYEATIAGSAHSGYLRVGVVQNLGSATLITIQSDRMSVWDGTAPAHTNKSENRSEINGSQVEDGSQTHSSGDVFMYALDIDNARAYFGRNGSFDLSFDPVNGTGGYNISTLAGYNSTDPWHILFQSLRSDQGVVTLRDSSEAQYLPSGYSYWGTI